MPEAEPRKTSDNRRAGSAWGEPRRANFLLSATIDGILAYQQRTRIDERHVREAFGRLRLRAGLTEVQVAMLRHLSAARNRRMGLRTLGGVLARSERDIAERIEPVLLRRGVIEIVHQGRQLTPQGLQVLGTLEEAR